MTTETCHTFNIILALVRKVRQTSVSIFIGLVYAVKAEQMIA